MSNIIVLPGQQEAPRPAPSSNTFTPADAVGVKYAITSYLTGDIYIVDVLWWAEVDETTQHLNTSYRIRAIETLAPHVDEQTRTFITSKVEEYILGMMNLFMNAVPDDGTTDGETT